MNVVSHGKTLAAIVALSVAIWLSLSRLLNYKPSWKFAAFTGPHFQACEPILWDGQSIGEYCVISLSQGLDPVVYNTLSISNGTIDWELQTAFLWMGPYEVSSLHANYEPVPNQVTTTEQSNLLLEFAEVSLSDHLHFNCSNNPTATYVSKAIMVLHQNNTTKSLQANVTFVLRCLDSSGHSTIALEPPNDRSHLRHQIKPEAINRQRETLFLPSVDYNRDGLPSLDWMNIPRNPQCSNAKTSLIRTPSDFLDEALLRKAYITNYLSGAVTYDRDLIPNLAKFQQVYDHFYAWDDGKDDVTVIAKLEGVCYASFRATDPFNFNDLVVQNLDSSAQKIPYSNCYIREGYFNAYFTKYDAEFEERCE